MYDRQTSALEGRPSDMARKRDASVRSSAGGANILKHNDSSVLERVPSLYIEYTQIILQIVKRKERRIASQLLDLLTSKSIKVNITERYTKSFADCEDISNRITKGLRQGHGSRCVPVRGGITKNEHAYHTI